MVPKYQVGQKVVVKPVSSPVPSGKDYTTEPYANQVGKVTEFYWISPRGGQLFYIYTVRIEADNKKLVLYEDELDNYLE